jgi:hypothetical protein
MLVEVKRFEYKPNYTIGKLYIDGKYECYTLEDAYRDKKIQDITAIPKGTYKLVIDASTRFKRDMPHILDVPNFSGVRIHAGNTSKDTEGCILLGTTWSGGDFIAQSKTAFDKFFSKLKKTKTATIIIS